MKKDFTKKELIVIRDLLKYCFSIPFVEYGNIKDKIEYKLDEERCPCCKKLT